MNTLTNIKIENYKTFTNEVVSLNDIACFVGPNESGKTNLLDAIYHLSKDKQAQPFKPVELRYGAPNFPNGEINITYTIKLRKNVFFKLINKFPRLEDKTILLTKKGVPKYPPSCFKSIFNFLCVLQLFFIKLFIFRITGIKILS